MKVLQSLSVRLGATTTTSLPHQTRKLILGLKEKYPKYRIPLHGLLWFLYILAEIAIVATDLAELLGTAIALNLYVFEDASKADEQVVPQITTFRWSTHHRC